MTQSSVPDRYCIIGAGASGLAVAKNFKQRGIPFDCLERASDIGGLWNIETPYGTVYETTHLVSSISSTGYDDFPMEDADYPEYPNHRLVLGYFRKYAHKFGIEPHIELGKTVTSVTPSGDKVWSVTVAGEPEPRLYRGVVLANGHHDVPRMPTYPGTFNGTILHSRDYRHPRQLRDRRVLVVGAGNSACDVASDAIHGGSEVFFSWRRGYWFVPKFMLGFPTHDVVSFVEHLPLPRFMKRQIFRASLWLLQGPPSRYRLPDPDYAIDQAHPTMSDEIPRLAAHGRLTVKAEIDRYDSNRVIFKDGSAETIDTIVFATGYRISLPFIDNSLIFAPDGRPKLHLSMIDTEHDGLYAAGLVQANGSMWRIADYQGQIISNLIVAEQQAPEIAARYLDGARNTVPARRRSFVASDRHTLEANYYEYRALLRKQLRAFRQVLKLTYRPRDGMKKMPAAAEPAAPSKANAA
ncbi:MAG: flavin-containing monooxygenase [Hyphomicrobiaceae bacterium]